MENISDERNHFLKRQGTRCLQETFQSGCSLEQRAYREAWHGAEIQQGQTMRLPICPAAQVKALSECAPCEVVAAIPQLGRFMAKCSYTHQGAEQRQGLWGVSSW